MLLGYYDGSGTLGDPNTPYLTLTGVAASQSVWQRLEPLWCTILARYGLVEFHASEAKALRGEFERDKGWDRRRILRLERELWNCLGQFRMVDRCATGDNLLAASCTVLGNDYRRASAARPDLKRPEHLCIDFCMRCLPYDVDTCSDTPEIMMFFDRNEPFQRFVKAMWQRWRRRDAAWPRQVRNMVTVSEGASAAVGLQVADLIAWTVNKQYKLAAANAGSLSKERVLSILMIEHHMRLYDYETLMRDRR